LSLNETYVANVATVIWEKNRSNVERLQYVL